MRGAALTSWSAFQRDGTDERLPRSPLVLTVLSALLIGLATLVVGTRLAGLEPTTVLTGSMRPAIDAGDLVLVARIAAGDARRGDVVTFRSPDGRDRTVTHRVVSVRRDGAHAAFVTRGDANDASEAWSVPAGGRIGIVRATVPALGRLAHPFAAGWSRGIGLALLTIGGACTALWCIWRPATP